jgi:hypothetical protein
MAHAAQDDGEMQVLRDGGSLASLGISPAGSTPAKRLNFGSLPALLFALKASAKNAASSLRMTESRE